jgi:hypothetical protein
MCSLSGQQIDRAIRSCDSEAACGRAGLSHRINYFHSITRVYSFLSVLHYAIFLDSLPVPEATAEVYSRPAAELYLATYKD